MYFKRTNGNNSRAGDGLPQDLCRCKQSVKKKSGIICSGSVLIKIKDKILTDVFRENIEVNIFRTKW